MLGYSRNKTMPNITDPAKDLVELCKKIALSNHKAGDAHLAGIFDVRAWSSDFYQIIFCIIERANFLNEIIQTLAMDDDLKKLATGHVNTIKNAFTRDSLMNSWNQQGLGCLGPEHIGPISMLSPMVREKISYPQLDENEINELLELVDNLENWLNEHQLKEQDFIRQAIIEGIKQFRFRLKHIHWFGWGYTIASLKEVIGAYMALQGAIAFDPAQAPDAQAVLKKVSSFVKIFYEKTNVIKGVVETGEFMLKAYGAACVALGPENVTALISHIAK
jgi:hypothetical protein